MYVHSCAKCSIPNPEFHSYWIHVETKLELNLLFDIAKVMANQPLKSFCITVLSDLIVEPNNKNENHVPLMILGFDTADATVEKAQVTCPNLIIGN